MTDESDFRTKLRQWADGDIREIGREVTQGTLWPDASDFERWASLVEEAADHIARLEEENERLREALEPFAHAADNTSMVIKGPSERRAVLTKYCVRAKEVLNHSSKTQD